MHVILHRLLGGFLRGLEQRSDVHIETHIGEGSGDNLRAPIVAVLTELDHQKPGTAALLFGEAADFILNLGETLIAFVGRAVDAGNGMADRAVA